MRKTIMFSAVALVAGFVIGIVCNSSFILPAGSSLYHTINASAVSLVPVTTGAPQSRQGEALDTEDNTLLLAQGSAVLEALKDKNYRLLATMVHPEYGAFFTPYSTVRTEGDQRLTPAQISVLETDTTRYLWGSDDGTGNPIRMTAQAYMDRYVFNADFTQAPLIGVDTVLGKGNALENVADSFPNCRFVEYHFPGLDPKKDGLDWCSLKLVFAPYGESWKLIALVHSEWTV